MTDQEYEYLKNKIYKLTYLDINCYKVQQMRRRLESYVARNNSPTVAAFCSELEKKPEKLRALMDYIAINVTEYFRDAKQFGLLENIVLPELLKNNERLNIWSAACSGGHEPYSVAILLEEKSTLYKHKIVATDIDQSALEQAGNGGPYLQHEIKNVEPILLEKYFTKVDDQYWVKKDIKDRVEFKIHNLLYDPYETDFDLIVCRNVIIYFSAEVREKLFRKFYEALNPNGVLFLGGSEVVLRPLEYGFKMLHPMFYKKINDTAQKRYPVNELSEVVR
jgi:chemotaxis protein methyltransferase CheR